MRGSYFNEYQQGYMHDLSKMPPGAKCRCGWYRRGECWSCKPEDGGRPMPVTSPAETEKG